MSLKVLFMTLYYNLGTTRVYNLYLFYTNSITLHLFLNYCAYFVTNNYINLLQSIIKKPCRNRARKVKLVCLNKLCRSNISTYNVTTK